MITNYRQLVRLSLLLVLPGCMATQSRNDLKHNLGEIAQQAPGFLWHAVPESELVEFSKEQWGGSNPLPVDAPLSLRMQQMVDAFDAAARAADPHGLRQIPKPRAVVLNSDDFNAYVTRRDLCVKQAVEIQDYVPKNPNVAPEAADDVAFSFSDPSDLATRSIGYGNCKMVDAADVGWDARQFVEILNKGLATDQSKCALKLRGDTIVVPAKNCSVYNLHDVSKFQYVNYAAAANTIFYFTKLLKNFDEVEAATVTGHELAHYYRGHATYLYFDPYFFQQSKNNELRKPLPTNHHQKMQQEMMRFSYLNMQPKVRDGEVRPALFPTLSAFTGLLSIVCESPHPCADDYQDAKAISQSPDFWELGDVQYIPLTGDALLRYINFERSMIKSLKKVETSSLNDVQRDMVAGYFNNTYFLASDFSLKPAHNSLFDALSEANQIIEDGIPKARKVFEDGAKLDLGYYSTEEEADEIGMELSARVGISGQKAPALFHTFHLYLLKMNPFEDPRATTYQECAVMRRNNWTIDGKSASKVLLVDSLSNIHHGMCYREFNSWREWSVHNLDRLKTDAHKLSFDEVAWKKALAAVPPIVAETDSSNDGALMPARTSRRKMEKPYCVFSSHRVGHSHH